MASPTPAELALVNQVFAKADPQKLGILTGDAALKVFAGTHLPSAQLGEIWSISDSDGNGFLTKKNTAVALRLIGHAQKGEAISEALVSKPGPLANIEGYSIPASASFPSTPKTPSFASSMGTSSMLPLTPQDKTKFLRIFSGSGPVNGLLNGDKARDIFLKSKLPYEKLSQIWSLADTQDRGSLDSTDFAIAMYFVQAAMTNSSLTLPTSLPPGLYEQAGGKPSAVTAHATGGSAGRPISPLVNSFTASQYPGGALNAVKPQTTGTRLAPQTTGHAAFIGASPLWDISPQEKATSDGFYRSLDTSNRGFIEGDVAVPFMLQSGLSEDILAQVWDLSDIQNNGQLTKDCFAVAMHLINGKLAGKDIPAQLPQSLIPPSLRQAPAPLPAAAPFSGITQDLWELNDATPTPASPQPPSAAGAGSPFSTPSRPNVLQPQSTGLRSPPPGFPAPPRGGSIPTPATSPPPVQATPAPFKDLLGDDDDTTAENATIHANSAEIGNLQNQISSTQRSLKSTQEERKTLEETVAAQASQLSALQSQLSTANAAYDTEKKLLENLQERLVAQNADMKRTKEELIRGESNLSAVKLEKSEAEGSVLRDKEEIRSLQRTMKETTESADIIKAEIEKARKEARQQKGLLAIAKKQLASSETDKEKALKDLEEAKLELEQVQKEIEEAERVATSNAAAAESARADAVKSRAMSPPPAEVAARVHLPETPATSPPPMSATSTKSSNPFFVNAGASPRATSPFRPFPPPESLVQKASEQPAATAAETEDPFGLNDEEPITQASTTHATSLASGEDLSEERAEATTAGVPKAQPESNKAIDSEDRFPPVEKVAALPEPSPGPIDTEFAPVNEIEHDDDSDSSDEFHDASTMSAKPKEPVSSSKAVEPTSPVMPGSLSNGTAPSGLSAFDDAFATPVEHAKAGGEAAELPGHSTASAFDDAFGAPLDAASSQNHTGAPSSAPSAFDDTFSTSADRSLETVPTASVSLIPTPSAAQNGHSSITAVPAHAAEDFLFSSGSESAAKPPAVTSANGASGASAFDEAMGKLPQAPASNPSHISFESNFGDSFDFGRSATGTQPVHSPLSNGKPAVAPSMPAHESSALPGFTPLPQIQTQDKEISFDDAFGDFPRNITSAGNGSVSPGAAAATSFDDAFGTDATTTASESTVTTTQPSRANTLESSGILASPVERARTPSPARTPTSPTSPTRGFSTDSNSPSRSTAAPARRNSIIRGSSSKPAVDEKDKRHNKLSLRFPFGKKGKDKEEKKEKDKSKRHAPPPGLPPSNYQSLSPLPERRGDVSPAVEDDAEPLKNLCQMGFSRSQALAALEANNFDMSKALNSLIAKV